MPFNVAFTPANFIKFLASVAINKIITKEGITIPSVAIKEPRIPPCEEPMKVAILIAIGPGVDAENIESSENSNTNENTELEEIIIENNTSADSVANNDIIENDTATNDFISDDNLKQNNANDAIIDNNFDSEGGAK